MFKTKGKVILTLLLTLIVGVLFATLVYAAPSESITIDFYTSGNAIDREINTNNIVEGSAQIQRGETLKLPARSVTAGSSFHWRTDDGRAWEGGSTVTFYEDTKLFPITVIDVYTVEELKFQVGDGGSKGKGGCKVRIMNDMEITKSLGFAGGEMGYESYFLLNGHKITIAADNGTAWGGMRHGSHFYGTGTVEYLGTGVFTNLNNHGYGGDHCRITVGRNVTINAPNAILANDGNGWVIGGFPRVQIYGTVNCKTVLELRNGTNRYPRIEVYDGAQLNLNGPLILHNPTGNTVNVNIYGGNITTTSQTSFFSDDAAIYTISGGSFTFANEGDYQILEKSIDTVTTKVIDLTASNGTTYKTVAMFADCNHTFEIGYTLAADCSHGTYDVFFCNNMGCDSKLYISYGETADHKFSEKPTSQQAPTKTNPGWNKYVCSACSSAMLEYLYYDPTNDEIKVTVSTENGEESATVKIKDIFTLNDECAITGIKAFGDYTIEQIVGIYVPAGIAGVNIPQSVSNKYIKTITFGGEIELTITDMKGLTVLENIVIENVSNLVFTKGCAPKTVKSIKSDVSGAKVEYKEQAFYQYGNLTEMTFSKNSSYTFGKQSFKESGVLSLDFVDGCRVNFSGEQAFYASKVEYLYVGKGITTLANKPFDCAYYLQKVILMDVTNLSMDYTFCLMNKGEKPCVIYHHADTLSLGGNTFYQSHGVMLYTKAQITTGFNSCQSIKKADGVTYPAYTIYYGITHEYERIDTAPTCTELGSVKFTALCPCGIDNGTLHKVFVANTTNSSSYTEVDYTNKEIEKLPHSLEPVGTIDYCDGYTKPGYFTYKCTMCKNGIKEGAASFPPLVVCYGYSVNEMGDKGGLNVKYCVNEQALREYQLSNGYTIEYGTIVALKKTLGEDAPLDESGTARSGVIKVKYSKDKYRTSSIKLTGLGDVQKKLNFVMSLYIIDGDEIFYIQDTETVENPSGVSYKEVKDLADFYESLSIALPVTTGDEEY